MSLTRACDHVNSALWPLIHQPYRVRRAASVTSRVDDVIRGRCVRAILRRQATFWGDRNRTGISSLDASKSDIWPVMTITCQAYSESLSVSAGVCRKNRWVRDAVGGMCYTHLLKEWNHFKLRLSAFHIITRHHNGHEPTFHLQTTRRHIPGDTFQFTSTSWELQISCGQSLCEVHAWYSPATN